MIVDHLIKYQKQHLLLTLGKTIKKRTLQALMDEDNLWFTQAAICICDSFSCNEFLPMELYEEFMVGCVSEDFFLPVDDLHKAIQGLNDLYTLRYLGELAGYPIQSEGELPEKTKKYWDRLIRRYDATALETFMQLLHEELKKLVDVTTRSFRSDRFCQLPSNLNHCFQLLNPNYPNPSSGGIERTKWEEECRQALRHLRSHKFQVACLSNYEPK